ncbi:MAG: FAD-dependent monooxygenase [Nitrospiraceae bacterium]
MKIKIVGAGVGGLTLAAALTRHRIDFEIHEAARNLRTTGYGLLLQRNALSALDWVGLGDLVRNRANRIEHGWIRTPSGRTLTHINIEAYAIHRGTLLERLAEHITGSSLRLGSRVESLDRDCDFVVAADGVNSIFRELLVPHEGPPRDGGCTAWRGLVHTVDKAVAHDAATFTETWGNGTRYGVVPIDAERVYWFAVAPIQPFGNSREIYSFLMDTFSNWHMPIKMLLEQSDASGILETRLQDRVPIPRWHEDRIILLGDSAHPMTPNLGQGGCQAIEDAVVLASLFKQVQERSMPMDSVGRSFERLRRARVHSIVERSFYLGRIANITNPAAVWLRNLAIQMTPAYFQKKQMRDILTFVPPLPSKEHMQHL